jgi:hypothetical protein
MVFSKLPKRDGPDRRSLFQLIKAFFSTQKDIFLAQRSSPPLHGINLTQGEFSSSGQTNHPGYDSAEESTR